MSIQSYFVLYILIGFIFGCSFETVTQIFKDLDGENEITWGERILWVLLWPFWVIIFLKGLK